MMNTEQQRDALLAALLDAYRWLERIAEQGHINGNAAAMVHYREVMDGCGMKIKTAQTSSVPSHDEIKAQKTVCVIATVEQLVNHAIPRKDAKRMSGKFCVVRSLLSDGSLMVEVPGIDDCWALPKPFFV